MKGLEYLIKEAKKFGLKASYINDTTIKLYSPKFFFDSWLIIESDRGYKLMHMNRCNFSSKCNYHLQSYCGFKDKRMLLEEIKKHNIYKAFYKKRNKVNLVDRILNKHIKERVHV